MKGSKLEKNYTLQKTCQLARYAVSEITPYSTLTYRRSALISTVHCQNSLRAPTGNEFAVWRFFFCGIFFYAWSFSLVACISDLEVFTLSFLIPTDYRINNIKTLSDTAQNIVVVLKNKPNMCNFTCICRARWFQMLQCPPFSELKFPPPTLHRQDGSRWGWKVSIGPHSSFR